jgi:hypothetical protein
VDCLTQPYCHNSLKSLNSFPVSLLVIALTECMVWWRLISSYQQIRNAKQKVLVELEERLPAATYGRGEWAALGDEWRHYWPMINLEQWLPILFGLVYVTGFAIAVTAKYVQ